MRKRRFIPEQRTASEQPEPKPPARKKKRKKPSIEQRLELAALRAFVNHRAW